ncbi:MAG: Coenzyme F420 hydrogenase/dehydrogenase, beta subunit C-terminal domain [Clostridia bacterium]|nr:Coenzyme F420 hydrogenase/dehydrogenase, beta subunit C-terminal domain [Clostridia bacterium]
MIMEILRQPTAYAVQCKDEALLIKSTSGGVFGTLAHHILESDGIVYGAAYEEDYYSVRHIEADNHEKLTKLFGSKYTLSQIGDAYKRTADRLKERRRVLFSGTPCQIAGLYRFLSRSSFGEGQTSSPPRVGNKLLITCDLVCHGTVDPKIYESYIKWLEQKHGAKVTAYMFRSKRNGWKTMTAEARFANGKTYVRRCDADPYYHAFLTNLSLRECCGDCKYSRIPRQGDLSLGDFWGVDKERPEWFDDKGLSVVLANTVKGQALLEECREQFRLFERVEISIPSRYNNLEHGSALASDSKEYQRVFHEEGFEAASRKYVSIPYKTRIREAVAPFLPRKVYSLLRKMF